MSTAEPYSINKLADITAYDRRTIAERLKSLQSIKQGRSNAKYYDPRRALPLIYAVDKKSTDKTIEQERLRKTREEADKIALENAKLRGELVDLPTVEKAIEDICVTVRAKVLGSSLTDEEKDEILESLYKLKDKGDKQ